MNAWLQRVLERGEALRIARLASALSIVALLAIFLVAALMVRAALANLDHRQTELRDARVARGLLVSLQLDEETGIRGYAATGDARFLQPYTDARTRWAQQARQAIAEVTTLNAAAGAMAERERGINATWNESIAQPVLRNPDVGRHVEVELRGKHLIDTFRAQDAEMIGTFATAASDLDARAATLVGRILTVSLVIGVLVALLVALAAAVLMTLLEQMRLQRQAYEDEKRVTGVLQEAFVQKALPNFANLSFDGVYRPASNEALVGGDWYDAVKVSDGHILFSIGDVVGHGVQSAVDMTRVRQAIAAIGIGETDPGDLLTAVNRVLELQSPAFVTALCGYIDLQTRVVRYAVAGHPAPIVAHADGTTDVLAKGGPPLGVVSAFRYTSFTCEPLPDDLIVFYTDGAIEYGRDVRRGEQRLRLVAGKAALQRIASPAKFIFRRTFRDAAPNDDVAILTARFIISGASTAPAAAPQRGARLSIVGATWPLARAATSLRKLGAPAGSVPESRRSSEEPHDRA